MRLFHVSEELGIEKFEPRPAKPSYHQITGNVVWAVGEAGLTNYLVPRDCPRISFFAQDETREDDVERFLDGVRTKKVLAVEAGWFDRIVSTALVQYEFAPDNFTLFDAPAHYYLSQQTETPLSVQTIAEPLKLILAEGVEVRIMPSPWDLRERVLTSSLGFSCIRMNYAAPPLP